MHPLLKLAASTLALGGLLYHATAHAVATNMAEQPLKASVLAKPNVLFGMDDSGSMDAEVMIDGTRQAWVYGNTSGSAGTDNLYPGGVPRNGSNSGDWQMFYLFPGLPTGVNSGGRAYGEPDTKRGYAIPPTPQLAWTRAFEYNPLYYNPDRKYEPWAPAYVDGALRTYGNSPKNAARLHPVAGTTTMDLTSNRVDSNNEAKFTFTSGMKMPVGAANITCYSGGPGAGPLAAEYTVPRSVRYCKATVSYFPATYWKKEACVVDGTTCVSSWDAATLKRYEIKPANYATAALYDDAIQNFANWFTYYRKRRLMLAAAMGNVLETMTGLRYGVIAFNAPVSLTSSTIFDADSSVASKNGLAVSSYFYKNDGSGGTPTHGNFKYIRDQFDTNTNVIQYACQRNAAFIITDGFANDGTISPPAYSQATFGGTTPYQTIATGSLADQSLGYFTTRLRAVTSPLVAGKVPPGPTAVDNPDTNTDLHVNTYALTLGMKGTVWPARTDAFTLPHPTWPAPVSNTATMIDDLWHATVNGRGQMYLATDIDSTVIGIQKGLLDIKAQVGAQSAVAVSTVNLNAGDGQAYLASYNPAGWIGDLTANNVDKDTGDISTTANWKAADILGARAWTSRVIITSNGTSGIGFTSGSVGSIVNPDAGSFSNDEVIDYLRGKRDGEGTKFRLRTSLIGSVINAEPAVDIASGTVFLASGEGMLHAFDTMTGNEEWAFVPYAGLSGIGKTVQREYGFKTKLDATPVIGNYTDTTRMLVGGMGAAGRSFYSIDVTAPKGLTEGGAAAKVMWTFPGPAHAAQAPYVGYSVGRPVVINSSSDGYVVLLTSGYDNGEVIGDGKGRMWMLNAATGSLIKTFTTTSGALGAESGLAQLTGFRENDGTIRYVYGGDLLGNVWKFDLTDGTTSLLTVLKDPGGNRQPVTTPPQLTKIAGAPVVMIGTGRLLDITDFGTTQVQTIYAIKDTGSTIGDIRASTTALTIDGGTGEITGTVDWNASNGWRVDLPVGQMVNTDPKYVLGRLFVNANVASGASCDQSSYGYIINVMSGYGEVEVLSTSANATHPLIVQSGDKMFRWTRFNDSSVENKDVSVVKPPNPRKNSWRDISR